MQIISSNGVTAPTSRLGTRYLLRGEATDGRALVEHEIPPRAWRRRRTSTSTRTSTHSCSRAAWACRSAIGKRWPARGWS